VNQFEIRELRKIDFRGAVVLDGFPSVGLVSSIVSNYLTTLLRLEYVGFIDSPNFPAVTVIRDAVPMAPARLYARGDAQPNDTQIAIFTSEFQPHADINKPLGEKILQWAIDNRCKLIVSVGGLVIEREDDEKNEAAAEANEVAVYGIASTPRARKYLEASDVEPFIEGVITGTSSILLREGKKRGFDVIVLLTEARQNIADAKASVLLMAAIDQMILKMNLELGPLIKEAEALEGQLKVLKKDADLKARSQQPQNNQPEGYY
jgi:uncharacterized protein